jgi:two-component system C4-dicarboxylate transport response regulator DctD
MRQEAAITEPPTIVVVVDDDADVLKALKIGFETEGFDVRAFSNAESLLAEPDFPQSGCLVVDQRLPGLNGLQLIGRLRDLGSPLPSVLITTPTPAVLKLAAAANVPVVAKPLLTNALVDTVQRLVNDISP